MPWLAWLAGCSKADLEIVLELVDPGGTMEAQALNRRVEIKVRPRK